MSVEVSIPSPSQSVSLSSKESAESYVIITSVSLIGECLISELRRRSQGAVFESCASVEEFGTREGPHPSLVLLHMPHSGHNQKDDLDSAVSSLGRVASAVSFGVLSDVEDVGFIQYALGRGARCYIPTSLTLTVVSQVLRLVAAGGSFVPWTALMQAPAAPACDDIDGRSAVALSSKEVQVVKALRVGTPNKLIAYQLGMCESTVKVHVRNIMKKLNARSRSQVVYIIGGGSADTRQGRYASTA